MNITRTFTPKTRAAWRAWLERNHARRDEIWLVYYKKHTGKPTIDYHDAVDEALCFGWIDSLERSIDDERYAHRFTPRKPQSRWSTGNAARYRALVKEGLMSPAGAQAYAAKSGVFARPKIKPGGEQWHKTHPMPKTPTLQQRVTWHREHQASCACRPIPKSLRTFARMRRAGRDRATRT